MISFTGNKTEKEFLVSSDTTIVASGS